MTEAGFDLVLKEPSGYGSQNVTPAMHFQIKKKKPLEMGHIMMQVTEQDTYKTGNQRTGSISKKCNLNV